MFRALLEMTPWNIRGFSAKELQINNFRQQLFTQKFLRERQLSNSGGAKHQTLKGTKPNQEGS